MRAFRDNRWSAQLGRVGLALGGGALISTCVVHPSPTQSPPAAQGRPGLAEAAAPKPADARPWVVEPTWSSVERPVCNVAVAPRGTTSTDAGPADAGALRPGTVSNAARVVASMRGEFRACYQAALGANRSAAGTVRLTMRIACDGLVVGLSAKAQGIPEETV